MKKQHAATKQTNPVRSGDSIPATELRSPGNAARNAPSQEEVSSISNASVVPSLDEIRLQAYYKWELAGRPDGNDLFFWVEAEREANSRQ